ncbi:hypothetical protein [Methanosarcina mazei]|nr:hypothetical protein [Methanosarcina mazei]
MLGRDTNSRRKYDFLCDILWNPSDIYITSIPGVVVEAFVSNNDSKMYPIKYNMFTFNMHSKTGNRQGIEFKVDQNCSLIGILKRYPDMLKYFYNALVEFWENAQNVGAISYDEEFPGFNEDDLPWFWKRF